MMRQNTALCGNRRLKFVLGREENIVGKVENAGKTAFSPFRTMFSSLPKSNFNFFVTFTWSSSNAFNLDRSKTLSHGKEIQDYFTM